ncbi:MAG: DUF885 domain-containing protein [Limisphaerales bacterium]
MRTSVLLLLLCLAAGCARLSPSAAPAADSADAAFARLAQEYISGYLAWRPQTGTALGLHEYDGKLTDYSGASVEAELRRLKSFAERVAALNTNGLSTGAFYDYRILRSAVQREIFSFDGMDIYRQNPMTYAGALDASIYIKRDFAPLETRARSVFAMLNQAPALFAAARANLAAELPRPEVETAIDQTEGVADFLAKDLVAALSEVKDDKLMEQFKAANQRAIEELRGYAAWLKQEKLPKANERYALGRDKYVALLQYGELVTASPERLLEIGARELRRQQEVFARAARQIDPDKKPLDVFKAIQHDHPTEKNLIADTAKDLEMIRRFMVDRQLITLPSSLGPRVAETPQFLRATSFASMDTPGPFETKATEAYYYVTPVEPDWPPRQKEEWLTAFNYYTTDVVSIHEVYPGHFVQFLCLKASPATRVEKIFSSYAFVEGWAHYAEQMMLDEGFGQDGATGPAGTEQDGDGRTSRAPGVRAAKYRLAQADEALLRLCRLCVSIRMHCQGMTVDEATQFFQDNCYYEPKAARSEAVRGTFDPEYLYYTLGKLEIFKLREDYRKQEGAGFTLRKFHDEMLRHGAPPIRLLRELMLKDRSAWDQVFE